MFYWRWFNRRHHPFARVLFGVLGLLLLVGVLTLGLFALLAFGLIGAIVAITRSLGHTGASAQNVGSRHSSVIEGEFVVLPNRTASIKH